jgi:rSAM/selenodomain-associated transferase 2/rSAM/selenodomain-associated transferase 1
MSKKVNKDKIVVFTRLPVPGKAKTRMIPLLGEEGAALLHKEMSEFVIDHVKRFCAEQGVSMEIRYADGSAQEVESWLGKDLSCETQGEGDLGKKMKRAIQESLDEGFEGVVAVGTDCPEVDGKILGKAFASFKDSPIVIGSAHDGGYYLIGMKKMFPFIFEDIDWGTDRVFHQTIQKLRQSGLEPAILETLHDIDRPEDYGFWMKVKEAQDEGKNVPDLSIVIPVLNEAKYIERTLRWASEAEGVEILVVDGGSSDGTPEIVKRCNVTLLESGKAERSHQMNYGAHKARGEILLFLHGDSLLPVNFEQHIKKALSSPKIAAGAFQFGLDESFKGSSLNAYFANLRSKYLQLPYGDQGLFMKRTLFERLGGFKEMPIMEDVDMVGRLRELGRIVIVPQKIKTSARRWKQLGYVKTFITNQLFMLAFTAGISPERIVKWYRGTRKKSD